MRCNECVWCSELFWCDDAETDKCQTCIEEPIAQQNHERAAEQYWKHIKEQRKK